MEITIKITPEEVAALVQAIQKPPKGEISTADDQAFQKAIYDALAKSESQCDYKAT